MTETVTKAILDLPAAGNIGLRRRLFLGFGAQGLSFVANIIQQLLLVPIFLVHWGAGLYSEWLILVAAADFVRLLEFGFHYHLTNLMRMAWARGEVANFERAIKIGMGLYAILLLTATPVLLVAIFLPNWQLVIGETIMSREAGAWSLALLVLTTLIMLPRNLIIAVYAARGEFSRGEVLNSLFLFVQTGSVAAAVVLGAGPSLVALVYLLVAALFGIGIIVVDQMARYDALHFGIALPSRDEVRELFEKARHYFVPDLSEIVLARAPVLILGFFSPAVAVVIFSVSRTFTGVVRQIALQIARASAIEMSRQYAQQDITGRRRLYVNSGRLIGISVGLSSGAALAFAEPLIRFWTHGQVPFELWVVIVFLAAILLVAPAQAGVAGLQLISQPRPLALAAFMQVALSLVLCVVLTPLAGALGAAIAVGIAEVAAVGWYILIFASREVDVRPETFFFQAIGLGAGLFAVSFIGARLLLTL
jgi:O-antigen/teichoic acid export membrane protein